VITTLPSSASPAAVPTPTSTPTCAVAPRAAAPPATSSAATVSPASLAALTSEAQDLDVEPEGHPERHVPLALVAERPAEAEVHADLERHRRHVVRPAELPLRDDVEAEPAAVLEAQVE